MNKKIIRKLTAMIVSLLILFTAQIPVQAAGPTVIDATTFRGNNNISTVHIGSNVTDITPSAFKGLMGLRSITVSEKNPYFSSFSNCLYNKDLTELLCFPAALQGAEIPGSVVSIRENALYGVGESLKDEIRNVVNSQAEGNLTEWQVPGAHFVHTPQGVMWRDEKGNITAPDTEIKKLAAAVVEACTTGEMRQERQLKECFDFFVNSSEYERSMEVPTGDWTSKYAVEMLQNGKGNCYRYAAAFAYIAKGLGYDTKICLGTVTSSLGGRTPHAWTEVKVGDNWYIYDTEMQGAKGSGYYKRTYKNYPAGPLDKQTAYSIYY